MKLYLFLFVVLAAGIFAQDTPVLNFDSLTRKGKMFEGDGYGLNRLWKFHQGDNPRWAEKDFDDSNWGAMPNMFMADTLPGKEFPGIGWFRLKIRIDSTLYQKTVGLNIWHLGASHIFLNGKFIKSFGKPGTSTEKEIFAQPVVVPVVITFSSDSVQVLVIRFSNFHLGDIPTFFWRTSQTSGFAARISEGNLAITNRIKLLYENFSLQGVLVGILFALGLSHLLIHFFYARNRLSLYFGLFAISLAALIYLGYLLVLQQSITWFFLFALMQLITLPSLFLFFVLFLFTIRFQKMPKRGYAYFTFSIGIALAGIFYFSPKLINSLLAIFVVLAAVEAVVSFIGMVREKIEGVGILIVGAAGFILLLLFSFAANMFHFQDVLPTWVFEVVVYGGFSSLPFSMSFYLARNYSKTSMTLENKLREVAVLSETAIEQERHAGALRLQSEMEQAKAVEAELRAQAAELQAKASELQAQALQVQNERSMKELEDARRLQLSMLPAAVPQIKGFAVEVFMKTATEVGGDYYDFIKLPNDELVFALGDAAGHGVKAGIMVTSAKSFFSSLAAGMPPVAFMEFTSKALKEMKLSPLYMCMLLGRLQGSTMRYVSAGMPQVLHYKAEDKNVVVVESKNVPLGTVFQVSYQENTVELVRGDVLLLQSDGFIEMFNPEKEMYGLERVRLLFQQHAEKTPVEILAILSDTISTWTGKDRPGDDVSFLIIKCL